jgi:hypothetical protein
MLPSQFGGTSLDAATLACFFQSEQSTIFLIQQFHYLIYSDMLGPNCHLLKLRASTLVVAISYWLFACLRHRLFRPRVTYGPMFQRDIERQANLRFIYESDDI